MLFALAVLPVLTGGCSLVNAPVERDLCALNADVCDPLARCESEGESFRCVCPRGFRDVRGDGTLCRDRDECADQSHDCHALATCHNEPGSFRCTCPDDHIERERGRQCEAPDPCLTGRHDCRPDGERCVSLGDGRYECACRVGYARAGERCADLDECALGTHDCTAPAQCENEPGAFACACPPGARRLDARTCDLPAPCEDHDCGSGARCVATGAASYECRCEEGYLQRTDSSCADVDECLDRPCQSPALCRNLPGSFECACPAYYALEADGLSCADRRFVRAESLGTVGRVQPLLGAGGELFVIGTFDEVLEVCGQSLGPAGSDDLFVAKYDAERACRWLRVIGGARDESLLAATLDAQGNPIVMAAFWGRLDLDGAVVDGGGYVARMVAKLDGEDGSAIWARDFHNIDGDAGSDGRPRGLAVDAAGDVLWTGTIRAGVDLDETAYREVGPADWHALLVELDGGDGSVKRAQTFASEDAFASAVAVDAAGDILLAGSFVYDIVIDGELIATPLNDLFVAKLAPDFAVHWKRTLQANIGSAFAPLQAASLADGDFVLAGAFSGPLVDPPVVAAGSDVLVTRIDGASGERRWTRTFGSDGHEEVRALAVDAQDRVFAAGNFRGATDFGEGLVSPLGDPDVFLVSWGPEGTLRWWQRLAGPSNNVAHGLAVGAGGSLVLSAVLYAPATLGALTLPGPAGYHAATLVELAP